MSLGETNTLSQLLVQKSTTLVEVNARLEVKDTFTESTASGSEARRCTYYGDVDVNQAQ